MKIIIAILIIIIFILFGVDYYLTSDSKTPEMAIKKYVFKNGSYFEAFNLKITPISIEDKNYGQQYTVDGFFDNETGMEIRFFYLKKSQFGWHVSTAGTGP